MTETIVLDPTAIDSSRTQVDITKFISPEGPDWGDAEIQAYMTDQAVGSIAVDSRVPNRVITIPLVLKTRGGIAYSTIRSNLQHKVALFQTTKRGSIMRKIGTTALYADIVNAKLHLGGSTLQAVRDIDVDGVLTIETLPDWYGSEVTLADHSETTLPDLIFTEATINGTYPGRVRIVVDNDSANDQKSLIWGVRSRNYSADATAHLAYEAEAMTPLNGAAAGALAGASGGQTVSIANPPTNTWVPILLTKLLDGNADLTHAGIYRVWARCYSSALHALFRLAWGVGTLSTPTTNPVKAIPTANGFYILDFGVVLLQRPKAGTHIWRGVFQVQAKQALTVHIDRVWLQPLDEYAGTLIYTEAALPSSVSIQGLPDTAANDAATGTVDWTGEYPLDPPAPSYSKVSLTIGETSKWVKFTNPGITIPLGSTIKGVEVWIGWYYAFPGVGQLIAKPVKGGSVSLGAAPTQSGGNDYYRSYGGPTDMWGDTFVPVDFDSDFGVAFQVSCNSSVFGLVLYNPTIIVYYTMAGGFNVAKDAVLFANSGVAQITTDGVERDIGAGTGIYASVPNVLGQLPRVPPSGLEGRATEFFIKASRGDLQNIADSGIDDISARVYYKPCYLITN